LKTSIGSMTAFAMVLNMHQLNVEEMEGIAPAAVTWMMRE